jgi:hypothetical protein
LFETGPCYVLEFRTLSLSCAGITVHHAGYLLIPLKEIINFYTRHWLIPVILATWEGEIRRTEDQTHLGKKQDLAPE